MDLYRIALVSTFCSLSFSSNLQAATEKPPEQPNRVGINLNYLKAGGACEAHAVSCEDSDSGWNLYYERDLSEKWFLGVAYGDLGTYEAVYPAASGTSELSDYTGEVSGPEIYGAYRYPLADKHHLTARVGVLFWQLDHTGIEPTFTTNTEKSGTSPTVGLGYSWDMTPKLSFNLGYQFIQGVGAEESGGANISRLSAGISYRFGFGDDKKRPTKKKKKKQGPSKPEIRVVKQVVVEKSMIYALDSVNSKVLFEHDDYHLTAEMEKELQPMLDRLQKFDEAELKITSHTDSTGTSKYNQRLSELRANSIKNYFVKKGINSSRITTEARGDTEQAFDNSSVENRAMNRRVVLSSEAFEREIK